MIKKYCDICERKIDKDLDNILNTGITIKIKKAKDYMISLSNPDHSTGLFPDINALCPQCFLDKFLEEYKDQLKPEKKDMPGVIPVDWKVRKTTDKEKVNEQD